MTRPGPTRPNGSPLPSCGLASWVVVELDGLLGAGVLHADDLEGLRASALTKLARAAIRHRHGGFDAGALARQLGGRAEAREEVAA